METDSRLLIGINGLHDRRSAVFLLLAVLFLTISLAQTIYRLTLPSEGWSFARDTTGSGSHLIFDRNLTRRTSTLQSGDLLLAIDDQPFYKIQTNALVAAPQNPSGWRVGNSLEYLVERNGRLKTVNVALMRLSTAQIFANLGRDLLLNPGPLVMLIIAVYVFFRQPLVPATRILLLFSAAVMASDGISQTITGTNVPGPAEMFHIAAF
jgi:hypothetical protein